MRSRTSNTRGLPARRPVYYRATYINDASPYWLWLLADACVKAALFEEAEGALGEALSQVQESGARFCEPELDRLKGELILVVDGKDSQTAEDYYKRALKTARRQDAKSLELRATTSLARLLDKQGRRVRRERCSPTSTMAIGGAE